MNHTPESNAKSPEEIDPNTPETVTEDSPESDDNNQCEPEERQESEPTGDSDRSREHSDEESNASSEDTADPQPENDSEQSFRESIDPKFMNKYIRDCLTDCFDYSQLSAFCGIWFTGWYNKLNQQSLDFGKIIAELIKHCNQHDIFEELWKYIKEENKNQYSKYYPRWKEAATKISDPERLNNYEFNPTGEQSQPMAENPLNKSDKEFIQWFFQDLNQKEQSLLFTTALFEGMSKHKLISVTSDMEDILNASNHDDTNGGINNNDAFLLEKTGVIIKPGQRNTEHGITKIKTFALEKIEHREDILSLLENPALYKIIDQIFEYIYKLGIDPDGEKRYFAAKSLSELCRYFSFIDLKSSILLKWAKDEQGEGCKSAAQALVGIIQNSEYKDDALKLLKNWLHTRNRYLINAALMAHYEILETYPEETLGAIEGALGHVETAYAVALEGSRAAENILSLVKITVQAAEFISFITLRTTLLIEWLYMYDPQIVIEKLYQWFTKPGGGILRFFAGTTFLALAALKDITKDDETTDLAVNYINRLLEDQKAPNHKELQNLTRERLHEWAKIAVQETNREYVEDYQRFFHALYHKCASDRRNRFDFYLKRWQKEEDKLQMRLATKGRGAPPPHAHLDFLQLIPSS